MHEELDYIIKDFGPKFDKFCVEYLYLFILYGVVLVATGWLHFTNTQGLVIFSTLIM